jgi:anti-sigma B factor antagonist
MMDLKTSREFLEDGTTCVVSVAGELDEYTAPVLERELQAMLRSGAETDIVDLTQCEFIDSSALGVLVTANARLRGVPSRLSLVTADRNIQKVFEITGLDRVFAIHPTRDAALHGDFRV